MFVLWRIWLKIININGKNVVNRIEQDDIINDIVEISHVDKINAYAGFGLEFQMLKLDSSITEIGRGAFMGNTKLENISISPETKVLTIDDWAFSECSHLSTIKIPDHTQKIGKNAFTGCEKLRSVSVPRCAALGEKCFPMKTEIKIRKENTKHK